MAKVLPPMITKVSKKVYLRPTISPMRPKTKAPNGRTTKPAANVAKVLNSAAVGFSFGKNWLASTVAKLPKM